MKKNQFYNELLAKLDNDDAKVKMKLMYEAFKNKEEGKPKEITMHTIDKIYPVIAFYKAMDDKASAYKIIEDYFAYNCRKLNNKLRRLARIPFTYKIVPSIMTKVIHNTFGISSGFKYNDVEIKKNVCHIDMLECPYHKCCNEEGVPELTKVFCNGDDISYSNIHKYLKWERTNTLGRGNDCCNFIMRIKAN